MPVRPPGSPWLTPFITVKDAAKALAFYETAFGFTPRDVFKDDGGTVTHGDMTWHDAVIMVAPGDLPERTTSPIALYIYCEDVDALFTRATSAGATVLMPPADMPWGDRMTSLNDPDGHTWNFATHLGTA